MNAERKIEFAFGLHRGLRGTRQRLGVRRPPAAFVAGPAPVFPRAFRLPNTTLPAHDLPMNTGFPLPNRNSCRIPALNSIASAPLLRAVLSATTFVGCSTYSIPSESGGGPPHSKTRPRPPRSIRLVLPVETSEIGLPLFWLARYALSWPSFSRFSLTRRCPSLRAVPSLAPFRWAPLRRRTSNRSPRRCRCSSIPHGLSR